MRVQTVQLDNANATAQGSQRRCPLWCMGLGLLFRSLNGLQTVKYMMYCTAIIYPDILGLPDIGVFFFQVLGLNQSTIVLNQVKALTLSEYQGGSHLIMILRLIFQCDLCCFIIG